MDNWNKTVKLVKKDACCPAGTLVVEGENQLLQVVYASELKSSQFSSVAANFPGFTNFKIPEKHIILLFLFSHINSSRARKNLFWCCRYCPYNLWLCGLEYVSPLYFKLWLLIISYQLKTLKKCASTGCLWWFDISLGGKTLRHCFGSTSGIP